MREQLKSLLFNRRLITALIGLLLFGFITLTANIPSLQYYTIVECEDTDVIETCEIIESELKDNLISIFQEVLVIALEPAPVVEETAIPEATETP